MDRLQPLEAELFNEPDPSRIRPPIEALEAELPLRDQPWDDFERLCVALAEDLLAPEHAQLFGERGDDQQGIDIYVLRPGEIDVVQCRQVDRMGPADIAKATDDFLNGDWAAEAATFVLATTQRLQSVQRAREVKRQIERLRSLDKSFVAWDRTRISDLLRVRPLLVRRFFGPEWERRFCGAPSTPPLAALRRLRPPTGAFTGRATELAQIDQHLTAGQAGSVALHGLGGVGKTELAARWAMERADKYRIAAWVSARKANALQGELAELARDIGVASASSTPSEAVEQLSRLFAAQVDWLLVVDGVRGPEELSETLPAGLRGHLLVTSQHHGGWRAVDIEPFDVGVLPRADAVLLLLANSGSTDADVADEIASRLGDLPLAVAQAGAFADATATSLAELLLLLEKAPERVLARGLPRSGAAVSRVWELAFAELEAVAPAKALLYGSAWCADNEMLDDELLSALLEASGVDPALLPEAREAILRFSLLSADSAGMRMHRLVAEALVQRASDDDPPTGLGEAVAALEILFPRSEAPQDWDLGRRLIEHALSVSKAAHKSGLADIRSPRLAHRTADYLLTLARPREAQELLQAALNDYERADASALERVRCINDFGLSVRDLGELEEAEGAFITALHLKRQVAGPRSPELVSTMTNLATVLQRRGKFEDALDLLEEVVTILEHHEPLDAPALAGALMNGATVKLDLHDADGALQDLDAAERLLEDLTPRPTLQLVAVQANRANALLEADRAEEAVTVNKLVIDRKQELYGAPHPTVADSLANLGNALRHAGQHPAAQDAFDKALRVYRAATDLSHPGIPSAMMGKGISLWQQGDQEGGIELQRDAVAQGEQLYDADHPILAEMRHNLGVCESRSGERGESSGGSEAAGLANTTVSQEAPQRRSQRQPHQDL